MKSFPASSLCWTKICNTTHGCWRIVKTELIPPLVLLLNIEQGHVTSHKGCGGKYLVIAFKPLKAFVIAQVPPITFETQPTRRGFSQAIISGIMITIKLNWGAEKQDDQTHTKWHTNWGKTLHTQKWNKIEGCMSFVTSQFSLRIIISGRSNFSTYPFQLHIS